MKIAVLIPVYNAERYLRECLDSVLAAARYLEMQMGVAHVLDIRCCDDGSTDTSASILAEYSLLHKNVSYVKQVNAGVVATRNRLMRELPSEYGAFAFVDSDDLVARETYAVLVEALERTCADVAECGITGNSVQVEQVVDDMSIYLLRQTAPGPWINVVNKLYLRKSVYGIWFRSGLTFEEDFFFNYEVNAKIHRKVLLPGVYYTYRDNPASATHVLDLRQYFNSTTSRIRFSLKTFYATGRIPKMLERNWCRELSQDAYRMCVRKNLRKNRNASERRSLFLLAGGFLCELERDFSFKMLGLNAMQSIVCFCARRGHYRLARFCAYMA